MSLMSMVVTTVCSPPVILNPSGRSHSVAQWRSVSAITPQLESCVSQYALSASVSFLHHHKPTGGGKSTFIGLA